MLDFAFTRRMDAGTAAGLVEQLVGLAAALNNQQAMGSALARLAEPGIGANATPAFAAFAAFLDALARRGQSFQQFADTADAEVKAALPRLTPLFAAARAVAFDDTMAEARRISAIRLMGHAPPGQVNDTRRLGELLRPQQSSAIQRAAAAALAQNKADATADILLAGWKSDSPTVRNEVLGILVSRPAWANRLLAAIEDGQVSSGQINPAWQQKLLKHADNSIRERATKLFSSTRPDRQALLKEYAGAGKLSGDAEKGFAIFRQNCAICHRLRGEGSEVGPDLGSIADKSAQALLVAILDPNQAVEDRYVTYTATTKGDREASGIITSETPNSITLRAADGKEEALLRGEILEMTSSGLSLMPKGFEKTLKPQDLADLIAALSGK
jgi:putative heme-binding domain-containing protein